MHRWLSVMALALMSIGMSRVLYAQQAAPTGPVASIHGHVNNAIGQVIATGSVKLSNNKEGGKDRKYQYEFPISSSGDYKGGGIKPGKWFAVVVVDSKVIDYQDVTLPADQDTLLNFDMQRPEFLKQLSPEELKTIEEYKKKNAGAAAYNSSVKEMNGVMIKAHDDAKAGKTADAVAEMKAATAKFPDQGLLWISQGDVELSDANATVAAAKAAKQPSNTPEIQQKFADSVQSYKQGMDLISKSSKPLPQVVGAAEENEAEGLAKSGKTEDAVATYDSAVKADPTIAASAYLNEAVTFYNLSKLTEAGAAADKAIAVDPKKADLYYIKAQSLIPQATVDPKTQKIVTPPGCVEAYQEYLELDPDGKFSADVKGILQGLGQPIQNQYKKGKH